MKDWLTTEITVLKWLARLLLIAKQSYLYYLFHCHGHGTCLVSINLKEGNALWSGSSIIPASGSS